jgi:branched-chain amino acid transport system permease protein
MSETALRAPTSPFRLDFDRLMRVVQRLFPWLIVLHVLWSIGVSSRLLSGLALDSTFQAGFWLIQQQIIRALVLLTFVGTLIGLVRHSGDQSGYGGKAFTSVFGVVVIWLIAERVFFTTTSTPYSLGQWAGQLTNGLIAGSLYALIALGYTLVYGILLMINFAHGDVMMLGSYFGYFALQLFRGNTSVFGSPEAASVVLTFLIMVVITLIAMVGSMTAGLVIERVAYRPLRRAPRLAPLISAIGMSIFLQQAAQRIFGPGQRSFDRPTLLDGSVIINLGQSYGAIPIPKIGIIVFIAAFVLMFGLYTLVQRTRIGRAMRAVAEDKDTAALMGANVDRVIAITFGLGAALAGAAGVMWGFYTRQTDPFAGFTPGLKAFTSAVLGGIGNIPGAVFGGIFLGLAEALGPFALGIPNQYQNVIAFALLVFVLIFRPTGILGEILAEKKV